MRRINLTWLAIIFCLYPVCFACSIENGNSGAIYGSHKEKYTSFSKCWFIPVPENTYVSIQMTDLFFKGACSRVYLKIKEVVTNNTNTFCNSRYEDRTFRALNNITISHIHDAQDWYTVSTFTLRYSKESITCTRKDHFRCSNHHCINKNQVCDRRDDCEDRSDETVCEKGIVSVEGANNMKTMAVTWLMERADSHSWGKDTHRAITALYLAQAVYESEENESEKQLKEELMVKQLELRTLLALLRNSSEPISISELSMFVNALIVTCHNPRQFYGYDLIRILSDRVSVTKAPCPGVYLTLCNSDLIVSPFDVADLLDLLKKNSNFPFLTDIQAMTIMALSCIRNKYEEYEHLFNDSSVFNETIERFIESQLPDGSFGNIYTTALIAQALISTGQETNKQWNITSTVNYFKQYFSPASMDFLSVYLALPIFGSKSLVDIGKVNCANSYRTPKENDISDVTERLDGKMFIQYSLFIGDEKDIIHTMYLKMPKNCSAYDVMRVAQVTDPKYKFLHRYMSGGMYVYQIADITNDPEAGKFWLLYTKDSGSKIVKSHTESPDTLILNDEGHLVMWYKTALI